jgi:hypothetical protein
MPLLLAQPDKASAAQAAAASAKADAEGAHARLGLVPGAAFELAFGAEPVMGAGSGFMGSGRRSGR